MALYFTKPVAAVASSRRRDRDRRRAAPSRGPAPQPTGRPTGDADRRGAGSRPGRSRGSPAATPIPGTTSSPRWRSRSTGHVAEAVRAYEWSRATQRPDGSWAAAVRRRRRHRRRHRRQLLRLPRDRRLAPLAGHRRPRRSSSGCGRRCAARSRSSSSLQAARRARSWWAATQHGDGGAARRCSPATPASHLSLRCAVALAELVGELVPEWELAAATLRHALDDHPERFADKARYSMDWYYPVLGGALPAATSPPAASTALATTSSCPGLGIRCVDDRPWVTGAETCELVLALDALGRPDAGPRAARRDAAPARRRTASYWTGLVFTDGKRWPVERTTWTGATVVLAADALSRTTGGNGLFRGEGLPPGVLMPAPCKGGARARPHVEPRVPRPARAAGRRGVKGFMPDDEGLALHAAAAPVPHGGGVAVEIGTLLRQVHGLPRARGHGRRRPRGHRRPPPRLRGAPARLGVPRPDARRRRRPARHPARAARARWPRPAWRTSSRPWSGARPTVARWWRHPIDLLFIDGGHSEAAARADLPRLGAAGSAPAARSSSTTCSRTPPTAARPPYLIYREALDGGGFTEAAVTGSLRVLVRVNFA